MGVEALFDLEKAREDFASFAFDYLSKGVGVERGLGADVDGAGSLLPGPVDEAGGGVDGAGGADDEHQGGVVDLSANAVHLVGNLTKEDDVGAETASAGAAADIGEARVEGEVWNRWPATVALAVGLVQFAVHVEKAAGAGALVEVVDVLRAEKEAVADALFEFGEGYVGGVGRGLGSVGAALGIELPDEFWIALPGVGRADIFNAIASPEAIVGAEGG